MIDSSTASYLDKILVPLRLSCQLASGYPLVVSLWFLYDKSSQQLQCATSASAKLVSFLERNNRVGFEIASDTPPYCGIRGYGRVKIREDRDKELVRRLYDRYFSDRNSELFRILTDPDREEVQLIISPEKITTWDFSKRMSDAEPRPFQRLCP